MNQNSFAFFNMSLLLMHPMSGPAPIVELLVPPRHAACGESGSHSPELREDILSVLPFPVENGGSLSPSRASSNGAVFSHSDYRFFEKDPPTRWSCAPGQSSSAFPSRSEPS